MVVEFIQTNPRTAIILMAVGISLLITLVNFFVLDKDKMRASRARQKELQKEIKEARKNKDDSKMMQLNNELMKHSLESAKHSFKPMIITILPILIIFNWMRDVFSETTLAGSWFWWYLIAVVVSGLVLRKLFKLP